MKIYFVRHQAGGVMWEHPFVSSPTDAQVAALTAVCADRHGSAHPKTDEPYFTRVIEVEALGPDDEIEVPEAGDAPGVPGVARIGLPPATARGVGHVRNPGS